MGMHQQTGQTGMKPVQQRTWDVQRRRSAAASASTAGRRLLGVANAGVPAAVHQEMRRSAEAGVLPIPTPAQRARIKVSAVSAACLLLSRMQDASAYVHANVPPPAGYFWRCRGSDWNLRVKSG